MTKKTILSISIKSFNLIKKVILSKFTNTKTDTNVDINCQMFDFTELDSQKIPITQNSVIAQFSFFKTVEKPHILFLNESKFESNYYSLLKFLKTNANGTKLSSRNDMIEQTGIDRKEFGKILDKLVKMKILVITKNNRILLNDSNKLQKEIEENSNLKLVKEA